MYDIGEDDDMLLEGEYAIGDEVEDMLTVGARRRPRGRIPVAQALARQRNVAVLKPREVLRPRNIWLPFPATAVAAGAQGAINANPQVLFRPERLLWPSDTAGSFTVDQIVLGKDNQNASAVGGVPARAFQEDCMMNVDLGLDTVQPNALISVLATNFSAAALTARIGMRGQSIQ